MRRIGYLVPTAVLALGLFSGCGGAPSVDEGDAGLLQLPLVASEEKSFHEWKKVFSIDLRGGERQRAHVGFIDRVFTESDREGNHLVRDRVCDLKGYVLPNGRAIAVETLSDGTLRSRDLGITGFDNGVKKILDVPGMLEYEVVTAASTVPPAN